MAEAFEHKAFNLFEDFNDFYLPMRKLFRVKQ